MLTGVDLMIILGIGVSLVFVISDNLTTSRGKTPAKMRMEPLTFLVIVVLVAMVLVSLT